MSSTTDLQEIGNVVVVVRCNCAAFRVSKAEGISKTSEDLLIAAVDDQSFKQAGDTETIASCGHVSASGVVNDV
jgi:hypothetical protein